MSFRTAVRKMSKLRLALAGPAGSGKTLSALRVAKGLGEVLGLTTAVIDTEKGSSELYAGILRGHVHLPDGWSFGEFSILEFNPPFSPAKYVKGIKLAEEEGFGILIVDSISHAWAGQGGILEIVDTAMKADIRGNKFRAWEKGTQEQNAMVDAILQSKLHVIVTMRTKTAWDVKQTDGKVKPIKIGLAPVQREGLDYEFTTVLDLSVDSHIALASKDRTGIFDSVPMLLTEETGRIMAEYLVYKE